MRLRNFGCTGLEVSTYGLGTWAMGGGIYGPVDDDESIRMIHLAEERGINFIDTAPMYGIADRKDGRAERVVGKALAGRRDRWIVATKYGRHLNGNDDWEQMTCDFSSKRARKSVEQSLIRLNIDTIDVLFVHSPRSQDIEPDDAFGELLKLRKAGKIRVIGFSFLESIADMLPLILPYIEQGIVQAVQVKQSLLTPDTDRLLKPLIRQFDTALVAREALARGFLTDTFTEQDRFSQDDWKFALPRSFIREQLSRANEFRFLIDEHDDVSSLSEAALNWVASHPETSTVIPGPRNLAELESCLQASDALPFDSSTMSRVEAIRESWDQVSTCN